MSKLSGFTIIELMIATFVFALVMLAALTGFLQIGRIFYQGVSLTQTQAAAQKIVNDVSGNIATGINVSGPTAGNGYTYYCVGQARYTLQPKPKEINLSDKRDYSSGSNGNFGLLRDILSGSAPCAAPCVSGCAAPFQNPVELLGNDMRLSNFSLSQSNIKGPGWAGASSPLWIINVTLAYGSDSVFEVNSSTGVNSGTTSNPECHGGSAYTQFCAVAKLNTNIYAGLHS